MPLSPKEQERIIEEETLKYETRRNLHAKSCASQPRRGRWLWYLVFFVLGFAFHGVLGRLCRYGEPYCPWQGYGMGMGHHCMMGQDMAPGEADGKDSGSPDESGVPKK
jgi:hypothetical protein